ncbi:MAG: hypothetical protein ACR2NN_28170 [Bryobacteraceae bacterium]
MTITKRFAYPITCMVLFAFEFAAQAQSWNNVTSLSTGAEIRIAGPHSGSLRGTLQSVTDDALVLNSSSGTETFTRQQVTRVSVKKPGHRARNTLIGLGVGAGAGLGIGAAADHSCASKGCFFGPNFSKAILTPFAAGVGALVGALIPSGRWREIYKQ